MAAPPPIPAPTFYTSVNLFCRAERLLDLDTFSKSDPYLVLFSVAPYSNALIEIGRTEIIRDSLHPQWQRPITVDYHFEMRQRYHFKLYDDDGKGPEGDDFLGDGDFELGHVIGSRGGTLKQRIEHGSGDVFFTAVAVSPVGMLDTAVLHFMGRGLAVRGIFGVRETYAKLIRLLPNGARKELFVTRAIAAFDPMWAPSPVVRLTDLVGAAESDMVLVVECWTRGVCQDNFLGSAVTSLAELRRQPALRLSRTSGTISQGVGELIVLSVTEATVPTFVQLLGAGLQVNVAVSIDFTGSNGDPRLPQSLHYLNPTAPNQYVQAITSVCDVVLEYDTDKLIPAFGFGAQLPSKQVSHCFHLNAQPDPNVHDLQGILDAYAGTLSSVRLSGPTNFAPSIRQAEIAARSTANTYTILLILTDGAITDTDATIDAIVACGDAPVSIIIVGVGSADFSLMKLLDGDHERLRNSAGQPALRDLVQFVPFRDFIGAPREALAGEVLREVPRQVEEWAQLHRLVLQDFAQRSAHLQPQPQEQTDDAAAGSPAIDMGVRPQQVASDRAIVV